MNLEGWILHDPKQWKINLLILPPNVEPLEKKEYILLKQILKGHVKEFLMVYYAGQDRYVMLNVDGDSELFQDIQQHHIHKSLVGNYDMNGECYYVQIRGMQLRCSVGRVPDSLKDIITKDFEQLGA